MFELNCQASATYYLLTSIIYRFISCLKAYEPNMLRIQGIHHRHILRSIVHESWYHQLLFKNLSYHMKCLKSPVLKYITITTQFFWWQWWWWCDQHWWVVAWDASWMGAQGIPGWSLFINQLQIYRGGQSFDIIMISSFCSSQYYGYGCGYDYR